MKNHNRYSSIIFILLFIGVCITSCQKLDKNDTKPNTSNKNARITFNEKGFLEFSSIDIFEKTIEELNQKAPTDLIAWEKAYPNFYSMRAIFEKGLKEDRKYFDSYAAKEQLPPANTHSPFVINNQGALLMRNNQDLIINTYRPELSSLLNKDGLVKVGNLIFQYSYNHLKIITDGNEDKINLLNTIMNTDKTKSIVVNSVSRREVNNKGARTSFSGTCENKTIAKSAACNWYSRVRGELTLASVNEAIYEPYNCVDITSYDEDAREWSTVTSCQYAIVGYSGTVNYFSGTIISDEEFGFCWNKSWRGNDQSLTMQGQYKENGVSKQLFKTTGTNYRTSQSYWNIFSYRIPYGAANVDITDVAINFIIENDPRVCRITFN